MQLNTYLTFDGECEAAFRFYQRCLGGEIVAMMRFGETPACEHVEAAARDKIMHARLVVDGHVPMGSDATAAHPYEGVKGAEVAINVDTPKEPERLFERLSEKGQVVMPIAETFWAIRFGALVDQFGVPWLINCEKAK